MQCLEAAGNGQVVQLLEVAGSRRVLEAAVVEAAVMEAAVVEAALLEAAVVEAAVVEAAAVEAAVAEEAVEVPMEEPEAGAKERRGQLLQGAAAWV